MEEDLNVMRYLAIPCHADALIYPILIQSKHTHTHTLNRSAYGILFFSSLNINSFEYTYDMKATKGSQHLIVTFAKQHGICIRLCCLLTLHCSIGLHISKAKISLALFISNSCFDAFINGFFLSFLSTKTTYNESNMIKKNGPTVLDNYCQDILNQS